MSRRSCPGARNREIIKDEHRSPRKTDEKKRNGLQTNLFRHNFEGVLVVGGQPQLYEAVFG